MKRLSSSRNAIRSGGYTLLELVVVMAILVIALAIYAPDVSLWLAQAKVRSAADHFQDSLSWAEGYAIRSGLPVTVAVTSCAWTITPSSANTLEAVPSFSAAQFAERYPGVACSVAGTTTLDISPTGMTTDPSTGALGSLAMTFYDRSARSAAIVGYWMVSLSGGGGIRDCAATAAANGGTACNLS